MDAAACVGVGVGVAPAPSAALLSRSFADAAIARALHFSLSDAGAVAAPEPAAETTAAAPPAAALVHGGAAGAHPAPARCRLGPAGGGRAGKRRRPRPSRRAPTTYISTDAATFRLMVERVTGAGQDHDEPPPHQVDCAGAQGLGGLLLPHLGAEHFALPPLDHAAHFAGAYPTPPAPAAAAAAEQPLFPTLDSWSVMYGKNEVA
ncbi:hypothetical protein ACP4OV_005114 [Aristida adscensionis]